MRLPAAEQTRTVITVAAAVIIAVSAFAATSATGQESAQTYIDKMAEAARGTYEARQLVVYLGDPQSSAIVETHSLAGEKFIKASHGSEVVRIWKNVTADRVTARKVALTEQSPPSLPINPIDVLGKFDVTVGEPTLITGMNLVPLDLIRRTDDTMIERLWVDPTNGMVYRRELFGRGGDVVGMTTMLDMTWGTAGELESPDPQPETVEAVQQKSADAPPTLPYGYKLVSETAMDVAGTKTSQWVYSDGLHTLSVFSHRGNLASPDGYEPIKLSRASGWVGPGPGTWVWQGGKNSYTLVAEETQLDPAKLTQGLPQGGPSRFARMGSWWAGAFHWVIDRF